MGRTYYHVLVLVIFAINVTAREIKFNDINNPIRVVETSYGLLDHERIDSILARIYPRHRTTRTRTNFPRSGHLNEYFNESAAEGDERGHLVASSFSGPADWYNLSPQNPRVNRNEKYESITTDWFGAECQVRGFLDTPGGDRYVDWRVDMTYIGNSNRPHMYHLYVTFNLNGRQVDWILSHIHNPFLSEDSRFWLCRHCRSNNHDENHHDELRRRDEPPQCDAQ